MSLKKWEMDGGLVYQMKKLVISLQILWKFIKIINVNIY